MDVGVVVDVGVGVDVGIDIVDETPPRLGVLAPKKLTTPVEAAAALGFAIDAVEPLKLNVSDLAALKKLPNSEAVVGAAAAAAAGMVTVDSECFHRSELPAIAKARAEAEASGLTIVFPCCDGGGLGGLLRDRRMA